LLFAVPNGGARNAVTAAILKAEGVVAGVADLLLLYPAGNCHGLCIEMKKPGGKQSQSQKDWQKEVEAQGYKYIVCYGIEDFRDKVSRYIDGEEI